MALSISIVVSWRKHRKENTTHRWREKTTLSADDMTTPTSQITSSVENQRMRCIVHDPIQQRPYRPTAQACIASASSSFHDISF